MMLNFCTLFDSNYLSRGLAMYYSLMKHCAKSNLYVICLDDKLYNYLTEYKLDRIIVVHIKEVEENYKELYIAKQNRSYVEYIFTLSPFIALYILERFPEIKMITTLDADIYFFSDPSVLFTDLDSFSLAITPHRFKSNLKYREKYGIYNVSFQTFKNDKIALECLKKWKEECLDWCYDRYENNKFADQKYLDDWPTLYPMVKEYDKGAGVASWNIKELDISINKNGIIFIKDEPLIFYHFHGVRNISHNWLAIGLNEYRVFQRNKLIKHIYSQYINTLSELNKELSNNNITRGTHPRLGKLIFNVFLADLYYYKNGKLIRIINLNLFRSIYSHLRQFITYGKANRS